MHSFQITWKREALMYCNGCGWPLAAGQGYCPRCGWVVVHSAPAHWMPAGKWPGTMERRIHLLATGWLVYAAVIGIAGACGLAFAHTMLGGAVGLFWGWHGFGHPFWGGHSMPFVFWPFVTVALFLRVVLALGAGVGLMQRTRWGRTLAIIAGCLALIHAPFGTALGIWTLVVLLDRRNAWAYEAMARG